MSILSALFDVMRKSMGGRWEAEWKRECLKRRHYTKSRRRRTFWSRYVGDTESHTNKRLEQGFFKKCRGFLGLPEIPEDPLRSPLGKQNPPIAPGYSENG